MRSSDPRISDDAASYTAHSPGRWRVGDAGRTIFGPNLGKPSPETIATVAKKQNAPLLAAAPDLLTGCRLALDYLESDESTRARYLRGILREAMKGVTP